jgi:coenzyme PQQ biosynthesis protein PqqD
MIPASARPRLASKAKLRLDKKTGQQVLLYPEKGLLLNPTGSAIVALCDGQRSLRQIVEALQVSYPGATVEALERDVQNFLAGLVERGLVEGLEP